eukprot:TRINITY_DN58531_c0_g1_i1.p1 TRINITY_DN58531_c0_g1~~TRINITY_DN58531_c0_g1_i1.p1  ORF type:complete len:469 (-),score=105.57 TRINITY_DN58531_c0_g1_i1:22-1428(-)
MLGKGCYENPEDAIAAIRAKHGGARAASSDRQKRVSRQLPHLPRKIPGTSAPVPIAPVGSAVVDCASISASASESSAANVSATALRSLGVSAAFVFTFVAEHHEKPPSPEASPESQSTRAAAIALKRRMQAQAPDGEEAHGSFAESVRPDVHFVTGKQVVGRPSVHVAHAWDSRFSDFAACIVEDADGNLDTYYALDMFTVNLHDSSLDPVAEVRRAISAADELLLVVDAEALALRRLWVLFELLIASETNKRLRIRCQALGGFGATTEALTAWEAHIDGIDWSLAEASRKADEKRIRGFAVRIWEQAGKGVEKMLAQVRTQLRREIYGQILLGAVEEGDVDAVQKALDMGANPEQMDGMGNTVEELASFAERFEIEELIFTKRMQGRSHMPLAHFFEEGAMREAEQNVDPIVLEMFVTEDDQREPSTAASSARRPGTQGSATEEDSAAIADSDSGSDVLEMHTRPKL